MSTAPAAAAPKRRTHNPKPAYQPGQFGHVHHLVDARIGSRPTIYRMIASGELPRPLKLGGQTVWTPEQTAKILSGEWFVQRAAAQADEV